MRFSVDCGIRPRSLRSSPICGHNSVGLGVDQTEANCIKLNQIKKVNNKKNLRHADLKTAICLRFENSTAIRFRQSTHGADRHTLAMQTHTVLSGCFAQARRDRGSFPKTTSLEQPTSSRWQHSVPVYSVRSIHLLFAFYWRFYSQILCAHHTGVCLCSLYDAISTATRNLD